MKFKKIVFILTIFYISIFFNCSTYNISSKWKNKDIKIDGNDIEWNDMMRKCGILYVGSYNDDEYLYMCLSSNNQSLASALTDMTENQKFIIRFYTLENKSIIFGLRFSKNKKMTGYDNNNNFKMFDHDPDTDKKNEINQLHIKEEKFNNQETSGGDFKIDIMIGNSVIGDISEIKDVETVINIDDKIKRVVCELKAPLKTSDKIKYAINFLPFKKIKKIGYSIEITEKIVMNDRDQKPFEKKGEPNTERGGNGFGGGGGMNQMGGGPPQMGGGRGNNNGGGQPPRGDRNSRNFNDQKKNAENNTIDLNLLRMSGIIFLAEKKI